MNSVFVYCEIEEGLVADVSLELLTKGRTLANTLNVKLEAVVVGCGLDGIEKQVLPYGVDVLWIADDKRLYPYTTNPHTHILVKLFGEEKPQIALMGATSIGRDLGPRVSSALHSGLTADCTSLEIGTYQDAKTQKVYDNLLYQIRPAFGGNIVATIVNPDCRPQMATVREGVMKKEILDANYKGDVKKIEVAKYTDDVDFVVKVIERHLEKSKVNLKVAPIIVSGGYGVGSKENFKLLHELGLEVLLEIHDEKELSHLHANIDMVGVNNRNLGTFHTDVENSFQLVDSLRAQVRRTNVLLVSESGISKPTDVKQLREVGFSGFLIGERFMKGGQPGEELKQFIKEVSLVGDLGGLSDVD
ncbi:electron transfer flavoprotein subunit alpha [Bacteroidia bacterium]|nr:electron transfer flavoprotein subunit alpha [Bacteroidia bacterium]